MKRGLREILVSGTRVSPHASRVLPDEKPDLRGLLVAGYLRAREKGAAESSAKKKAQADAMLGDIINIK